MQSRKTLTGSSFSVLILSAIALCFAGCASGNKQFFKSWVADPHPSLSEYDRYNMVVYTGEPKIYVQHFDEALGRRLMEDGFVILGCSSFNGNLEGEDAIKNEAKRLGAEIAVAEFQYSHTRSGVVPVTTYSPQTVQTSGTVYTSSGNWARYSGTSTGTSMQTNFIPYSVSRYDQSTFFLTRQVRPRILGALTVEMTADDRRKVGANQGVCVFACVRDSPAWRANILAGDYIVAMDGQPVASKEEFMGRLEARAGQQATLSIVRGPERLEIAVVLNPDPMKVPSH